MIVSLLVLVCPMERLVGITHEAQLISFCSVNGSTSNDMSNTAPCSDIHFSKINFLLGILPESARNIFIFLAFVFAFFAVKKIYYLFDVHKYVTKFYKYYLNFVLFIKEQVERKIHRWLCSITGRDYAFLV